MNANAPMITGWIMLDLVQRPGLLEDVRMEVQSALDTTTGTFDIAKLTSLALISAVHQETLRLRNIVSAPSRELLQDIEVGGYQLKAGRMVILPSYLMHMNEEH